MKLTTAVLIKLKSILNHCSGPFLLKMMPDALTAGLITQFLHIIINIVKYNAAYIDEEIMSGFVQ